ncbi:MAG: hypothetical protein HFG19_08570, partial [Oscillospiraceae bacterium]|nr:hypothetical protein [Oscillospiraceae bacterium]
EACRKVSASGAGCREKPSSRPRMDGRKGNGNVGAVKKILTEQEEEDRESSREEKYRDKRERWRKNHTEYLVYRNGEEVWVRGNELTQDQIDNETYGSRVKGEMPDSYWDY